MVHFLQRCITLRGRLEVGRGGYSLRGKRRQYHLNPQDTAFNKLHNNSAQALQTVSIWRMKVVLAI